MGLNWRNLTCLKGLHHSGEVHSEKPPASKLEEVYKVTIQTESFRASTLLAVTEIQASAQAGGGGSSKLQSAVREPGRSPVRVVKVVQGNTAPELLNLAK